MLDKLPLYNPTGEDFTITYDINGNGNPVSYTLHAQEIEYFENPVYQNMKKHLAHKIAERLKGKGTYEDAIKKALKQIEV